MQRRTFLAAVVGSGATVLAGCASEEYAMVYTLEVYPSSDADESVPDTEEEVLDFDSAGLSSGQRQIVIEATDSGMYVEGPVAWEISPTWEQISPAFKSLVQMLARHAERDPNVVEETRFETWSRYRDRPYRTIVGAEPAE